MTIRLEKLCPYKRCSQLIVLLPNNSHYSHILVCFVFPNFFSSFFFSFSSSFWSCVSKRYIPRSFKTNADFLFLFCFAVPCECTTEDVQDMGIYRHAYAGELFVQLWWGGVVVADTFARLVHDVTDIQTNCQA